MKILVNKLLCGLLTLMLLASLAPAALADGTILQVQFTGLYATPNGEYKELPLAGLFDVYQNDQKVGVLEVTADGENAIALNAGGSVRLVPVAGSYPAEAALNEYGYSVSVTEDRLNIAPLKVYVNAGLFVLHAAPDTDMQLLDAQGGTVLSFRTDAEGYFAPETAVPAGVYTLRAASGEAGLPAETVEIQAYTGADSVPVIRMEAPAAEPAAAPTATAEPTVAPTATPEPTAVPTATPAPTAAPTATPEPAPEIGTLTIRAEGEAVAASYAVYAQEHLVAQGEITDEAPVTLPEMAAGEYLVTLTLADNMVLTGLNGTALAERGQAQWVAAVMPGQESVYTVAITETGSLVLPLENVSGAKVSVTGEYESFEMEVDEQGVYRHAAVLPGVYTVRVELPAGRYELDTAHWSAPEQTGEGVVTSMTCGVDRCTITELPLIRRNTIGSAMGTVADIDGDALKGVQVTLYAENGQAAATAETDRDGQWSVASLPYGAYVAQYAGEGRAIPATSFTLNDAVVDAVLAAKAAEPAKITVHAFLDENNNGTAGRSEKDVRDVEVALISQDGTAVATGLTDRSGKVTLYAPEGKYTLRATVAQDYGFGRIGSALREDHSIMDQTENRTQTSGTLTLTAGKTLEVGIGVQPMAIVTGTVWEDLNADGLWQEDEPGIPGVRLTLEGTRNSMSLEVFTDENGVYTFRQVRMGGYELTCYVPDDYVFTYRAEGDLEKISRMATEADRAGVDTFTLERGEVYENHNIGMMDGATIEGVCFLDANYNGVYDEGDEPLPDVELRLSRQSNNVLLQKTTSDENGRYKFVGQRGSTFAIRATLPRGCFFSVTGEGENGNRFEPDGTENERRLMDVTLEHGEHMQVMVGAVRPGSISGRVYYDENFSGAWEQGEQICSGYYVTLLDAAAEKIITYTTDKSGNFTFKNLKPGQYMLRVNPAKGYAFTALGDGNVMKTQADGSGLSGLITVGMGEEITGAGAGMIVPAAVHGSVFADDNDNGLQDAAEAGLQGTVVRLMSERGEAFSTTIGESGSFSFNAVLPGRYYLQYELPDHAVFSAVTAGGNAIAGENGTGMGKWFSVNTGDSYTADSCGGVLLSDISGLAFTDSNGTGAMEEGEALFAGLSVTLTPSRSDLQELTVVTGADGAFAFNNLRPDAYTLTVLCPDACVLSRMPHASLGLNHGLTSQSVTLNLQMGTQLHDQLLGCVLPSVWTGEAYLDENYDGRRGADEAPACGETLVLLDADTRETVATVQTDAQGRFTIEGVTPGEYELVYPMDEGNLLPADGAHDFRQDGSVMTTGRVTVRENENKHGTVLCVVRTTEMSGRVWLEEYDGLTPVSGVKLRLLDASGAPLQETVSGEDGSYVFKGLMPGEYAVDAAIQNGYVLVECTDPRLDANGQISIIEASEGVYGRSGLVAVRMAGHVRDLDVGMVMTGRLGDKVWLDLNGNGLQDGEEGGIPGVTIELLRGDRVVASTVSDQYGYYVFEGLYPTEYVLRVTWPAEVKPTVLRPELQQIVSVLQENGLSVPVLVESNKANYAADLGFVLLDADKLPAGYGEGEVQNWRKNR